MENSIYIALSRQTAVRREMGVAAHNIANMDTPAFKREFVLYREFQSRPAFREQHSFVDDLGTARDTRAGGMDITGNQFDLALSKEGYFVVDTPMGERYTRHGRFQLDDERRLINGQGYLVQGDGGEITIPPEIVDVQITSDGVISAEGVGELDRIRVIQVEDETMLKRAANSLYVPEQGFEFDQADDPGVIQGAIEGSNIQPIVELTRMIDISRNYQAVTKFAEKEDERIAKMIDRLASSSGA